MPLQTVISFAPNHAPCLLNAFLFSGSAASTATHISVTLCHNGPKICISTTLPTQSPGILSHSNCSSWDFEAHLKTISSKQRSCGNSRQQAGRFVRPFYIEPMRMDQSFTIGQLHLFGTSSEAVLK